MTYSVTGAEGFAQLVGSEFSIAHPAEVNGSYTREGILQEVQGAVAIFCAGGDRITEEILEAAGPSLKVVSTMSVGFNHIDIDACKKRNIQVGHTPYVLDRATAETAVALTFAVKRRIIECSDSARQGTWGAWQPFGYCGSDVSDNTVGVIGLGRIGLAYARMLKYGFNCKIIYTGPREKPEHVEALGGDAEFVDLPTLLQRSDIISVHSPLNDSTRHLINTQCFAQMKPSAVIVNTSRGDVLDQEALVHALETKQIAAAGLDVTSPEPLPPSHKLFCLSNCVILPHIGSATVKTRQDMINLALSNMVAGLQDKPLAHSVV